MVHALLGNCAAHSSVTGQLAIINIACQAKMGRAFAYSSMLSDIVIGMWLQIDHAKLTVSASLQVNL